MSFRAWTARVLLLFMAWGSRTARAATPRPISLEDALRAARRAAPELVVARAREGVAQAEVGIAGMLANPTLSAGTSTQSAPLSATISVPLAILGQRGASMDAARADARTVSLDTRVTWNDIAQATRRAYVALWLAQGVCAARRESALLADRLEGAVRDRVAVGSAPEIDSMRAHAEKLRADASVIETTARAAEAATELGRWMGGTDGENLQAAGPVTLPAEIPTLAALLGRLDESAPVRREQADVRAAEARASRERALARPGMALDLGADIGDPTLSYATNYRAQLAVDVPIFNQRGPYVRREQAAAEVARARVRAARIRGSAELTAAYHAYEAATAQERTLVDAVVPAAQGAAHATEEAYALGRAELVAVLDAERSLVEARLSALDVQAARANAWADVEHALGAP